MSHKFLLLTKFLANLFEHFCELLRISENVWNVVHSQHLARKLVSKLSKK